MSEETDKQSEARRVLDAIRNKEEITADKLPQSPKRWLVSEDAAQLQALVEQSRGIRQQIEEKPQEILLDPEDIETISSEQIKVMRKSAVNHKHQKTQLRRIISEGVIRAYFDFIDFFKPSGRAKRCLLEGHQCVHCGEKFEAKAYSALNSADSPAQQSTTHTKI